MTGFAFDIEARDGAARTGRLATPRGIVRTPAFMPVGTAGTVKALYMDQVRATGAEIILGNTYHLMLRPGAERVHRLGGLHAFCGWDGPILTDSGGFQVWSLADLREMDKDGVTFRSHIDGSAHRLTPERSIEIQADLLGADISMQLDECTDYPASEDEAKHSLELSLAWGERCKAAFGVREHQALFGIVQGSVYPELRRQSAEGVAGQGFDGVALGGLSVGEGHAEMCRIIEATVPHLPATKPRYVMGVGKPVDIVEAVSRGIDMFDCVLPTRSGRHGQAWTWDGPINVKAARYAEETAPLDPESDCPASRDYSLAYLNHLFRAGEYLGPMLLSWHNTAFFQALMTRLRAAIAEGRLEDVHAELVTRWDATKSGPRRP